METRFLSALETARQQAALFGVRIRPITDMQNVHRCLTSHRQSDGFYALADKSRLDLSLEALAVKKEFTGLFSDEEANCALMRLLDAGYTF